MKNQLNFRPFRSSRLIPSKEKIGIRASKSFYFYSSFYKKHKLHQYRYIQINWDKSNKAIGFLFTNNEDIIGVMKISHRGNSASIRSLPFWRETDINPEEYKGDYTPHRTTLDSKDIFYILLPEKNEKS